MKAVRCTAESFYTAAKLLAAIAVFGAAQCASAAVYYWKLGATQGQWTDLSNWSTEGVGGTSATSLPGSSDELYGQASYNFLLGGQSYAVKKCYNDTDSAGNYSIALENGTLEFTSELRCIKGSVDINNAATLRIPVDSTIYTGLYRGAEEENRFPVNINFGGSMEVLGTARFFNTKYSVANGGTLTFSPSTLRISTQSYACRTGIENNGTLNLPNGLSMTTFDSSSATGGASFTIWQNSGTMTLGGPITKNNQPGTFNVDFADGTVNVTGNASFDVSSAQVSGPVTFNVAEGKTLNTTSLEIVGEGVFTKTGPGYIAFPATAQAVTVSEGGVALDSGTYNLSAVTFAANTTVRIATFGGTINQGGYPASLTDNTTFTADLSAATSGTTIFNSDDATLLGKIKTDLATFVPQGLELTVNGTQLMLETATSDADTFTITGNITEGTGWGGSVPGEGANVAISGEGVVGTLPSGASFPAWASIEVKNGATLRIETDTTLPPITLNKHATLEIGNNATVTLANAGDLSGVVNVLGDVITIPVLSIESGATLNVPGGMKFANVDIALLGKINVISAGTLTIGYAANGDSTYIGFHSNGGSVFLFHGNNYDASALCICCPESGGTVCVVNDGIVFENMTTIGTHFKEIHYSASFHIGVGNPSSERFDVIFSNTKWGTNGNLFVAGGGTFIMQNGSSFVNSEEYGYYNRHVNVTGAGRIIVGDNSELRVNALGNYGDVISTISADTDGHEAIIARDRGIYENYVTTGNGRAVCGFSNGVYRVYLPSISEGSYVSKNVLFEGAKAVSVDTNSVLTLSTRNGTRFTDESGDRVVALANVPITGGGSIALSNDNVNVFGVIVTCGSNTATGSASVVAPAAGKGETTLYFADGANWAGTVVAGNVALTNLVEAAAPSTNSFGKLALAAGTELKLRVWKTNGAITAHDGLNVGEYVNNGGRITLVEMDEPFGVGDKFVLGTIGENSPVLPVMSKPWRVVRDGEGNLVAKASSGLTIILR